MLIRIPIVKGRIGGEEYAGKHWCDPGHSGGV